MSIDYIIFTILGGLFIAFIIFLILECARIHFLGESSKEDSNYTKYQIVGIIIIAIPLILLDLLFNCLK